MEKTTKVSIIMGIYNCADTLEQAIESIINQTYSNWELIMCDDCSKDSTVEVAEKYVQKYPDKIRLIKNKINITLGPTLNRCIELVDGEYIARQDGDDYSHKTRLEEEVKFLQENKEYDLVATNMVSFDTNGEKGIHSLKDKPTKNDYINRGVIFSHATIVIKTEAMRQLNGYSEKWYVAQAEDYELWSRFIIEGYKGYNLQKNLYYVREDINAYKRKNVKRRLRGIILMVEVYKRLHAPLYSYAMIFKNILAIFIPRCIFIRYYQWKLKN